MLGYLYYRLGVLDSDTQQTMQPPRQMKKIIKEFVKDSKKLIKKSNRQLRRQLRLVKKKVCRQNTKKHKSPATPTPTTPEVDLEQSLNRGSLTVEGNWDIVSAD